MGGAGTFVGYENSMGDMVAQIQFTVTPTCAGVEKLHVYYMASVPGGKSVTLQLTVTSASRIHRLWYLHSFRLWANRLIDFPV